MINPEQENNQKKRHLPVLEKVQLLYI